MHTNYVCIEDRTNCIRQSNMQTKDRYILAVKIGLVPIDKLLKTIDSEMVTNYSN